MTAPQTMEVDLATLGRAIARGSKAILIGTALGLVAAWQFVVWVPARFEAQTLLLIKTPPDATSLLTQKLGALAELAPGGAGVGTKGEMDTEVAMLLSRAVLGLVVDSLRLQVSMRDPARVPALGVIDSVRTPGRFAPRRLTLQPGRNALPEGTFWVKGTAAPYVKIFDREEAIDDLFERLDVRSNTGAAVRVRYRGPDSLTAARVPNLVVETYLARRRVFDRGTNQRRFEFLSAKADSVGSELTRAARDLRATQEGQQLFDAEPEARAIFERVATLETRLAELRAEQITLDSVLARAARTGFDPRLIAGVPSLMKSPAVNEIVAQLERVESQRAVLLTQYADGAPQVVSLGRVADSLRAGLVPLARTFGEALARQRRSLETDVAQVNARIASLPAKSELVGLRTATLKQIATLNAGMTQLLLQARLAAIGEGGEVRLVDRAVEPRKVEFPRPSYTYTFGALAGCIAGLCVALVRVPRPQHA